MSCGGLSAEGTASGEEAMSGRTEHSPYSGTTTLLVYIHIIKYFIYERAILYE